MKTPHTTPAPAQKFVAYFRVSTQRQGASGLGLEGQRAAIAQAGITTVAEFVEVESGSKNNRPQLAAALALCKAQGATLVVAKLDRLARNAAFLMNLKESGVDFRALDCPDLNTLTLGVMASVAQYERERISERTKTALAAAKARGTRIGARGTDNLKAGNAVAKSAEARRAYSDAAHADVIARIHDLRAAGRTWRAIAERLNEGKAPAPRGGQWQATTCRNLYNRTAVKQAA